jgi:hypothetical protein
MAQALAVVLSCVGNLQSNDVNVQLSGERKFRYNIAQNKKKGDGK